MATASQTSPGKSRTTPKRGTDAAATSARSTRVRLSGVGIPTIPAKAFTAARKRIDATLRETDQIMKEAMALIG